MGAGWRSAGCVESESAALLFAAVLPGGKLDCLDDPPGDPLAVVDYLELYPVRPFLVKIHLCMETPDFVRGINMFNRIGD
jgi:hypothetical protein